MGALVVKMNVRDRTSKPKNQNQRRGYEMTVKYAALAFDLTLGADKAIRLLPMGGFASNDGRPAPGMQWVLNDGGAARIVNFWNSVPEQMVIDYEHQTQKADFNGLPAPAAGWSINLEVRADGVYGLIDWTDKARAHITAREYRYISPVFSYDSKTGEVLMLHMAALTNTPGLTGLTELNPAMLKRFLSNAENVDAVMLKQFLNHSQVEENDVDKELLKLLGLDETAKPEMAVQAVAALQTILKTANEAKDAAVAQVAALKAEKEAATTELATLKAAQGNGSDVVAMAALQTQVVSLQAQLNANEVAALVAEGLADGRILESSRAWAEDLGKKDVAQLKGFLAVAPKIAALQGQQSAGMPHGSGATDASGLTADELAVCSSVGMTPAAFAAAKKELAV
jgi:phage I-like protein